MAQAQALAHPYSLAVARAGPLSCITAAARCQRSRYRRGPPNPGDGAGFPLWVGFGTCWQGWALAMQGESRWA